MIASDCEHDYKLVYISGEYSGVTAHSGGIGTSLRLEAEWFASRGFEVHVLCPSADGNADSAPVSGVRVHTLRPGLNLPKWRAIAARLSAGRAAAALLRDQRGIVIAPDYDGPLCTKPFRQRLLVQLHGCATVNGAACGVRTAFTVRYFERRTLALADAIQSCAAFTAQRTAGFVALAHKPTAVIPNSVDIDQFHPETAGFRRTADILFIGKLALIKGVFTLAQALPDVFEAVPEARLLLVGPDTVEDGRSVKSTFLERVPPRYRTRVCFLGNRSRLAVAAMLRRSAVLVVPSVIEAAPMVILEAMASGRPVVASRRGGIPEIVLDGVTGLLAEPEVPGSFASALLRILQDPGLGEAMGRAARVQAIERHAPDRVYERTLAFHRQLLGMSAPKACCTNAG